MPHEHHDHPHSLLPPEPELRVKALETILVEKGLVDPEALQLIIDTYQHKIGPQIGARLVARAWADARFKDRLLNDTDTVLAEAELAGRQGEHVVVVENTADTHNLVVCTLCSCYPWPLLGIPPGWYKSDAYKILSLRLRKFGYKENLLISSGDKYGGLTGRTRGYAVFSMLDVPFEFEPEIGLILH